MKEQTILTFVAIVATLAIVASRAAAQSLPDSSWPPPSDTIVVTGAPVGTALRVPRNDSFCQGFLSAEPTDKRASGTTLFWYRVMPGGEVRDVKLYRSSGNAALDAAAIACANGAYRRPAIISGMPASVVSIGAVDWVHSGSPDFEADPDGTGQNCGMWYPPLAVSKGEQGTVTVGYRIGKDGTTKDATIIDPSDSRLLNAASLKCVAKFRFFPSYQNDKPTEIDMSVRIEWHLEGLLQNSR